MHSQNLLCHSLICPCMLDLQTNCCSISFGALLISQFKKPFSCFFLFFYLHINLEIKMRWKWKWSFARTIFYKQIPVTYQRGSYGGGRQSVRNNDEEDRVAQQQSNLEGDPLSAVWWQIETNNVHHHQEDAGQQQVHGVEQWPPPDHHLEKVGLSQNECMISISCESIFCLYYRVNSRETVATFEPGTFMVHGQCFTPFSQQLLHSFLKLFRISVKDLHKHIL